MKNIFKDILKGKVVIVGVGNPLRGDDGFGPALIEKLTLLLCAGGGLKKRTNMVCFDVGSSPENYTGKIAKENPDTILIVDAVHLEREAGAYELLRPSEIVKSGFTTHDISPRMFLDYLKAQTKAEIHLLAVQPENISFGSEFSPAVTATLVKLSNLIKDFVRAP